VSELAAPFSMSQPAISKHLKVLERAGLIAVGQDAQRRPRRLVARPLAEANHWLEGYRSAWEEQFQRLDDVLAETDVLYVTRVQKERFDDVDAYESVRGAYIITPETLRAAKPEMIVMHPFPRVGEISMDVDDDPRAAYFRQIEYGLYVRMALLAMVLGRA